MKAIPEITRFLGLQIDEKISSDLKYALEMLSSMEPKMFFTGLKILAAIHESNEESEKRTLAEKILSLLCKVIPSYVKRNVEFYELNKTKMEDSIRCGKHPLDLRNTLALAKRGSIPAGATGEKPTGFVMSAAPHAGRLTRLSIPKASRGDEDDIKVISIEEGASGEEELVEMAKQDAAMVATMPDKGLDPGQNACDASDDAWDEAPEPVSTPQEPTAITALPSKGPASPQDETDPYEDDEWVSAGSLEGSPEDKLLFDEMGQITKDLKSGLDLINPVEREREIDRNYSTAKGYHDIYSPPPAAATPVMSPYLQPDMSSQAVDLGPSGRGVDLVDASSLAGQPCGFGDGTLSAADGKAYVCPYCKAAFHEGCGRLVMEVQGGRCPACDAAWM